MKMYINPGYANLAAKCLEQNFEITKAKDLPSLSEAALLDEIKKIMMENSGRTEYRLAGGCKGIPLSSGTFSEIVDECREKKISYIINGLETTNGILGDLAQKFTNSSLADVTMNCFISVKESQASPLHYDYHDLVNIQLLGAKHWEVFDIVDDISYPSTGYVVTEDSKKKPIFIGSIAEGSAFTIPKGFAHTVSTLSEVSVHIAIGFRFHSIGDIYLDKVRKMLPASAHQPMLASLTNLEEAREGLNTIELDNFTITTDEMTSFILSRQKLLPCDALTSEISILQADNGCFIADTVDEKIKLSFPAIVNRNITVDPQSFTPGILELPQALEEEVEQIFLTGFLDLIKLRNKYDKVTADTVIEIFVKTGLFSA